MLFTTVTYVVFLIVTVGVTFSLPVRHRVAFLAFASYFFYFCWKPSYALVIFALTAATYFASFSGKRHTAWLAILANVAVLCVFKYLGFFAEELNALLSSFGAGTPVPVTYLLLPLGISFHTLQMIAYIRDVQAGVIVPERNFMRFALFVSWFPQMIAGPIERGSTLLPQLKEINLPSRDAVYAGLWLILIGFFKKLVLADNLAAMVNTFFESPTEFGSADVWFAVYGYGFQLYFDFSAYMAIAMGSSLLFGIRLSENFRDPFLATSLPDFWRRWHITLTTWFFEYVYYPLMRRFPRGAGPVLAVIFVFTLSGLWHGANRTFILWGLLHGILYCLSPYFPKRNSDSRISQFIHIAVTFNIVCLCWVLFRSASVGQAGQVYSSLFGFLSANEVLRSLWPAALFRLVAVAIADITLFGVWKFSPRLPAARVALAVWIALLTLTFGEFASHTFIYFQF